MFPLLPIDDPFPYFAFEMREALVVLGSILADIVLGSDGSRMTSLLFTIICYIRSRELYFWKRFLRREKRKSRSMKLEERIGFSLSIFTLWGSNLRFQRLRCGDWFTSFFSSLFCCFVSLYFYVAFWLGLPLDRLDLWTSTE